MGRPSLFRGFRHFNSIKVQLEHKPRRAFLDEYLFQFHKGTIRTGVYGYDQKLC